MATGTDNSTYIKSLQIRNAGAEAITLCLEPWGEEYPVEHGESLQIVFEAAEFGEPEVLHEPHYVTVYAWPTATFHVLRNGVQISNDSGRVG